MKLVDIADLKSAVLGRVGSSPTTRTINIKLSKVKYANGISFC